MRRVVAVVVSSFLWFPFTALAQVMPPIDPGDVASGGANLDGSALSLIIARALLNGRPQWLLASAAVVVAITWVIHNVFGRRWPFWSTTRGKAILAIVGAQAAAVVNVVLAGDLSYEVVVRGLIVGWIASGGFTQVRALLFGDAGPVVSTAPRA